MPIIRWQILLVFGLNTGKCGPEITPYLNTFHSVKQIVGYTDWFIVSREQHEQVTDSY